MKEFINKLCDYVINLPLQDKIIAGLCIALCVAIFFCIYNLLKLGSSSAKKLYEYTSTKEIHRKIMLEESYKDFGAQETKGFLNHIDRKIEQSGFKNIIKNLNSELYIIIACGIGFVVAMIVFFTIKNMLLGIMIFCAICLFFYLLLEIKCTISYKQEEKDLMMFMNLAHSYSVATDDLIQILDLTAIHMGEPLRSKIQEACVEARISGSVTTALRKLSLKIGHEKLNEVLCNFEIGSKYQANYAEMVEAMSEDFRIYLKQKDETKAQGSSAFIVQIIVFVAGCIVVKAAGSFLETHSIKNLLLTTPLGNFIIGYFSILILFIIIKNLRTIK